MKQARYCGCAPLLLVVALVAIAVAGYWLKRPAEAVAVRCADPLAGCTFSHHGAAASVRFSVRPAPLEAFELSVTRAGRRRDQRGIPDGRHGHGLQPL